VSKTRARIKPAQEFSREKSITKNRKQSNDSDFSAYSHRNQLLSKAFSMTIITKFLLDSEEVEDDRILANSSWIKEVSSFNNEITYKRIKCQNRQIQNFFLNDK